MARARAPVGAIAALLLFACSGGSSSPTEPDPPPVSLAGTWRGELSGTDAGAAFTCSVEVDLTDQGEGVFIGGWNAGCGDATMAGVVSATSVADLTVLIALRSFGTSVDHRLGTCGWSAPMRQRGSELTGNWEPPQSCVDTGLMGGPLRLRFAG